MAEKNNIIYLVPHTHYDAVWVFTKQDYFYINIDLILKQAIDLMEKSDYKFLIEQTFLLEEIEKRNPRIFAKIRKFIDQGKIEIACGEYLMADTMLAKGETLIREILFGKRYIKEKFGIDVPVMWGADSFGYNAQLPQIYKKSGYRYFAFRRGVDKNKPSEFWWQGLDGTKILSHWMPKGYRAGLDIEKLEENCDYLKKVATTRHILVPAGSGVSLPEPKTIKTVKDWNKTHKNSEMRISKSIDFFEALEKETKNFETRKGELYSGKFSEVFPNCLSSRMWIKQGMRKHENLILSCEKWATVLYLLFGYYPFKKLKKCWKVLLFSAFHDVLPGTGIDECYKQVRQNFAYLEKQVSAILQNSLSEISKFIKTDKDIIVFNPLSFETKNWTETELNFEKGKIKRIQGLKNKNQELEVEILEIKRYEDKSIKFVKIGFIADVPGLGYQTYQILQRKPRIKSRFYLKTKARTIKNSFFEIKVNPENGLIDIYQKGKHIAGGNELVLEEEVGGLYYHKQNLEEPFKTETGQGIKYGSFRIKNFKIKESSLRKIIDIDGDYFSLRWPYRLLRKRKPLLWRHKFISFSKKIIIYKDIPKIDFITKIDNRHPRIRIRLKFSTNIKSKNYFCESQFGAVSRPTNQYYAKPGKNEKYKENPCGIYPCLNWIDFSDKQKGLTIINKGIPANEIRDGNIYLTLLRSVSLVSWNGKAGPAVPIPDAEELKKYVFEYSVFPHQGKCEISDFFKQASELNYGLNTFQLSSKNNNNKNNKKVLPLELSFIKIKPDNVVLTALKKAEDGNKIILRFFETKGKKTQAEISLFKNPKTVKIVNLLEKDNEIEKKDFILKHKKIKLEVKPFEIITFELKV